MISLRKDTTGVKNICTFNLNVFILYWDIAVLILSIFDSARLYSIAGLANFCTVPS
jgi:hypothetical protein